MEFGIVLMVLLLIMFAIMEFSRFFYVYNFVSDAAREGTRYAAVRGATFASNACSVTPTVTYECDATAANVTSYVQSLTPPMVNPSILTVNPSWPGTAPPGAATPCNTNLVTNGNYDAPGCLVQVVVSYPYTFIFPFLPQGASTWTVSSTAEMVISE